MNSIKDRRSKISNNANVIYTQFVLFTKIYSKTADNISSNTLDFKLHHSATVLFKFNNVSLFQSNYFI